MAAPTGPQGIPSGASLPSRGANGFARQHPVWNWLFTPKVTRAFLAIVTVVGYFLLLMAPILGLAFGRISESDAVDMLKTIAAVVGGPAGLVIGFYFSERDHPPQTPPSV